MRLTTDIYLGMYCCTSQHKDATRYIVKRIADSTNESPLVYLVALDGSGNTWHNGAVYQYFNG